MRLSNNNDKKATQCKMVIWSVKNILLTLSMKTNSKHDILFNHVRSFQEFTIYHTKPSSPYSNSVKIFDQFLRQNIPTMLNIFKYVNKKKLSFFFRFYVIRYRFQLRYNFRQFLSSRDSNHVKLRHFKLHISRPETPPGF